MNNKRKMIKSNYQIISLTTVDFLSLYRSVSFVDVAILFFNVLDDNNNNRIDVEIQ
jgi:hypothetical protein